MYEEIATGRDLRKLVDLSCLGEFETCKALYNLVKGEYVRAIYPEGIHRTLADAIVGAGELEVRTATLEEPEHGLTDAVLDATDTLVWWGHLAHD